MAGASGYATFLNLFPYLNDSASTIAATNPKRPTADELVADAAGDTGLLVATSQYMPSATSIDNIRNQAASIRFIPAGATSAEILPGVPDIQEFSIGFAFNYPGSATNIYDKWIKKTAGDYIECAIVTGTGTRLATPNQWTSLPFADFSLWWFAGKLLGTEFNFGSQSDPSMLTLTVGLEDPFYYFADASA